VKHLAEISSQQFDSEIAALRTLQKKLKANLDKTHLSFSNQVPTPLPTPPIKWSCLPNKPHCNIRLRYSLTLESVLCTIRFIPDGSQIAFTDGRTVYFISQTDGSTVGTSDLGRSLPEPSTEAVSRALCFSPDSKFLAVSGPNNSTSVIEVATRRRVATLEKHRNIVSTIDFFKTSARFVTGGFDGQLCVWNIPDFKLSQAIQHGLEGKEEMIAAVAVAPEDQYLVVGFMSGTVGLYDPTFSQPMASFQAHAAFLFNVTVSNDEMLATGSHDRTTKLWVVRGIPSCRFVLSGHTDSVLAIAFAPRDPVVFTGSKDETIKCWNRLTGECLLTVTGHKNTLFQVDHHPSERVIVSCSGDGLVCVWDYVLPERMR
jgi:WD40 repeat protein